MNLAAWQEWRGEPGLVEDVLRMLDNVLSAFIKAAPDRLAHARYAAWRERSVGLGVMGFHSYLQANGIPFGSATAAAWNLEVFRWLRCRADAASHKLARERGPCPDAAERGVAERFSHKLAVAPTASISIICGGASAGIEPFPANIYTHKTLSGAFSVRNPHLQALLADKGGDRPGTWQSILEHDGSVQHLPMLSEREKEVFRTAFEIDQSRIVALAGARAPYICQSQSVNLFLGADVDKWDLHKLHWMAWQAGLKSLYYCRSKSLQRPAFVARPEAQPAVVSAQDCGEVCLACQ
jgi:ribonucleoside-diphosphate reductase alpha chain